MLLDEGYEVNFFDHVLHRNGKNLPDGVRAVKHGLDYIRTLTSCSHYVGYGSSGIITNSFMPGATQILLESDWLSKCPRLFRLVVKEISYPVATTSELRRFLTAPPKDDLRMREYLFGKDRTGILGKVEEAVSQSLE